MTKIVHCKNCNSMHTPNPDGSKAVCDCGRVIYWWTDSTSGIVTVSGDRALASVISVHNGYINEASDMIPRTYYDPPTGQQIPYPEGQIDTFWRSIHEQATLAPRAPEPVRVWDRSHRACPFAIIEPGTTIDVQWE